MRQVLLIITMLLFIQANAFAGGSLDSDRFIEPQLAPDSILLLAKDKAVEGGYKFEKFKLASLSYDYLNREWFVGFKEREFSGALGAHFVVKVVEGEKIEVSLIRGI